MAGSDGVCIDCASPKKRQKRTANSAVTCLVSCLGSSTMAAGVGLASRLQQTSGVGQSGAGQSGPRCGFVPYGLRRGHEAARASFDHDFP